MAAKEKKKKLPKRTDELLHSLEIECANCGVEIKPESPTYQKCKCLVLVFCSPRCKKRSDHFNKCKEFKPDNSSKVYARREYRVQFSKAILLNSKLKLDIWEDLDVSNQFKESFDKKTRAIHFIRELDATLKVFEKEGEDGLFPISGLGSLVASRSSDQLLEIIQDTPGVGLSKDEWGFKELHQIREKLKEKSIVITPSYLRDLAHHPRSGFQQVEDQPKLRTQLAERVDPESTMNDLKKIVEGPEDIDFSDHAVIRCVHFKDQGFLSDIVCRQCFLQGYERARAVASGAFMFSYDETFRSKKSGLEFETVIYETETSSGLEMREEIYFLYPPDDFFAALRYLSLHSADVDPRMICMNPDLYWSIICFYGSITKALKEAGGQRFYEIGFGKHEVDTQKVTILPQSPMHLSSSLIEGHFVDKFANKEMEVRYCCANPGCFKFEDTERFLLCGGCAKVTKRRYCSMDCYEKDWEEHQKHCQGQKEGKDGDRKEEDQGKEYEVDNGKTKKTQGAGAVRSGNRRKRLRRNRVIATKRNLKFTTMKQRRLKEQELGNRFNKRRQR